MFKPLVQCKVPHCIRCVGAFTSNCMHQGMRLQAFGPHIAASAPGLPPLAALCAPRPMPQLVLPPPLAIALPDEEDGSTAGPGPGPQEGLQEDGAAFNAHGVGAGDVAMVVDISSGSEDAEGATPEEQQERASKRPRFQWKSPAHIANARACKKIAATTRRAEAAEEEAQSYKQTVQTIGGLLPDVAKLVGLGKATAVGRKRLLNLVPADFGMVVRAMHLPPTTELSLGVKLKRLVAAGARLVLRRQGHGLQVAAANSAAALQNNGSGKAIGVHLAYTHLWDEVELKFRWASSALYRPGRAATTCKVMVQRGVVSFGLADNAGMRDKHFEEQWICKPMEVAGSGAKDLHPALRDAFPPGLHFDDLDKLKKMSESVSSVTVMLMCDKASSNVAMMKYWGQLWEDSVLPDVGPKVLLWPDTCGVHLHHRCKLQLRDLKAHTVQHFCMANLFRLKGVRQGMIHNLEQLISQQVTRVVGPVPDTVVITMEHLVDLLFKRDAPHHRRKDGKPSQRIQDLQALATMVNGDIREEQWRHYCWDPATKAPCCSSAQEAVEKTTVACVNAFFAGGDPIPAESRWTNTLANFKRTLIRRLVHRAGLMCFRCDDATIVQQIDVDGVAMENFMDTVNRTRRKKTSDYYSNDGNMHCLAVLTILAEVADSTLLYPMLGDPVPHDEAAPSKMDLLLNKDQGLIAKCLSDLLSLLDGWLEGGPLRVPWSLLDALKAPVRSEEFMRWARSQVLRLNSALFRRYEVRFSCWPYRLYGLQSPGFGDDEQVSVCQDLLAASREMLDVYSLGIRMRFPTVEALRSYECITTLKNDFRTHAYATDFVERLNAELARGHPTRAPARSMAHASRESVLRQAAVEHRKRGGADPLRPAGLRQEPPFETLRCSPLLPIKAGDTDGQHQTPSGGAPLVGNMDALVELAGDNHPGADHMSIANLSDIFEGDSLVTRENPAALVPQQKAQGTNETKLKRGLSPYMLERNRHLAATKLAKGSTLTADEVTRACAEFRELWQRAPGQDIYKEAYQHWRADAARVSDPQPVAEYKPMWGGGCRATPVTKEELCAHIREEGWPKELELADLSGATFRPGATDPVDFAPSSAYNLWGVGRWPRNVMRTPQNTHRFNLIEKGFFAMFEDLGREAIDSGEVMLVVDGPSVHEAGQRHRSLALVTGVCYNPKVFEVTTLRFDNGANVSVGELTLPCDVMVADRRCRVPSRHHCLDCQTSDEFIERLCNDMSELHLSKAEYKVIEKDGSNRWSRITAISPVGCLWMFGQKAPLFAGRARASGRQVARASERLLHSMLAGDPFDASATATSSATRASGRPRCPNGGHCRGHYCEQGSTGRAHVGSWRNIQVKNAELAIGWSAFE